MGVGTLSKTSKANKPVYLRVARKSLQPLNGCNKFLGIRLEKRYEGLSKKDLVYYLRIQTEVAHYELELCYIILKDRRS